MSLPDNDDLFKQLMSIKQHIFSGVEGKKRRIFFDQVSTYMTNANQQMSELTARERHRCQEGCSFCCLQMFAVYQADVEVISLYLLEHEELLKAFLEKAAAREKLIEPHLDLVEKCAESEEECRKFFGLKIPCAFLDEGKCSIYPVRPVACSSHISRNSPRICAMDPTGFSSGPMIDLKRRTWLWMKARSRDCFKQDKEMPDVSRLVYKNLVKISEETGSSD
jgi:Fe-S-cluster containining protein